MMRRIPLLRRRGQRPAPHPRPPVGLPFVWHIALSLLIAAGIATGVGYLLWRTAGQPELTAAQPQPLRLDDIYHGIIVCLAALAVIATVVGLVVAYRRQRFTELQHARSEQAAQREDTWLYGERFAKAADQLGSDQAAVRLAGVYAAATLADEWVDGRQMCIEVLCAYLRMPYPPTVDAHAEPERVVRHTIVRLVGERLRDTAPVSWQGHTFDFTGAVFDGGDFGEANFAGSRVLFQAAVFASGKVTFIDAAVSGTTVSFRDAVFSGGEVTFSGSVFASGDLSFDAATFSGAHVLFDGAAFSGAHVSFRGATFASGEVSFARCAFSQGDVTFARATFAGGRVSFENATFFGGRVYFGSAVFSGGQVSFHRAEFAGRISFSGAMFSGGEVDLEFARFSGGEASFGGARFAGGRVSFDHAAFTGSRVSFGYAAFSGGEVSFGRATFSGGEVDLYSPSVWGRPPTFASDSALPPAVRLPAPNNKQLGKAPSTQE